ncbi:hypothetical protein AGMMS49936_11830 [Endomicrobiia bacterium]|nr:hypothetical protein AGMMS49936_11830 [Endomicrobiia bacterium]
MTTNALGFLTLPVVKTSLKVFGFFNKGVGGTGVDADDIGTGGGDFVDEIVVEGGGNSSSSEFVGNFVDGLDGGGDSVKSSNVGVFRAVVAALTNNFSDDIFCKGGGMECGGGDGEGGGGDIADDGGDGVAKGAGVLDDGGVFVGSVGEVGVGGEGIGGEGVAGVAGEAFG